MNKNLATKIDGKWKTIISIKEGTKGMQFSIRRKEFVDLLKSNEEWINLAVFDAKPREQAPQQSNNSDERPPF